MLRKRKKKSPIQREESSFYYIFYMPIKIYLTKKSNIFFTFRFYFHYFSNFYNTLDIIFLYKHFSHISSSFDFFFWIIVLQQFSNISLHYYIIKTSQYSYGFIREWKRRRRRKSCMPLNNNFCLGNNFKYFSFCSMNMWKLMDYLKWIQGKLLFLNMRLCYINW